MDVEHLDVVLDAKLGPLERGMARADAIADRTEEKLSRVKLTAGQAAESAAVADRIGGSVSTLDRKAASASEQLGRVKLTAAQAAESVAAGDVIDRKLKSITGNANEARRAVESVGVAGFVFNPGGRGFSAGGGPFGGGGRFAGGGGDAGDGGFFGGRDGRGPRVRLGGGRNGVGVGPFGSGFGRIGLLGAGIAAGVLTGPAAGPGAVGLLAAIPTLAAGGAGALGTLALAFAGVGKAIGGDKKAFDQLTASQQTFVLKIRSLDGWLDRLKQTAASNMFPGLTAGLTAALSPGTVTAIGKAVQQFATAIGNAGAAWGRYFGSGQFQAIFGPLMSAGAKNLGVLSNAMLSLFDAFGVVGRAAIPLVNWLTQLAARGARIADTWLRAQDASGGLARAMQAAQGSLVVVGRLFGSVANLAFALGKALYPISMVLVPALAIAFNALAGFLDRNRATIALFGKAIVKDVIAVIQIAIQVVGAIGRTIDKVFGPTGVRVAIIATAAAIGLLIAPWATIAAAAILAVGEIIRHWSAIVGFFKTLGREIINVFEFAWVEIQRGAIMAALGILRALDFKILGHRLIPGVHSLVNALQAQLDSLHPPNLDWSAAAAEEGARSGSAWARAFDIASASQVVAFKAAAAATGATGPQYGPRVPGKSTKAAEPKPGTHAWYMKYLGYDPSTATGASPFGTAPPFTSNLGPKATFTPLPSGLATQLANAQTAAQSGSLADLRKLEQVEKRAITYLNQEHVTGKKLVQVAKERLTLTRELLRTEKQISQQVAARREEKILGLAAGGGQTTPGAVALRMREHKILEDTIARTFGGKHHTLAVAAQNLGVDVTTLLHKTNQQLIAEMTRLGVEMPKATLTSLNKINQVLKEKFIPPDVRENIRARLAQIEETLKSSSKKLASNYTPVHSTDVVKGLGLDRAQKLAVESRVSQALAHGGMAPTGGAAAGIPLASGVGLGSGLATTTINGGVTIVIEGAGKNAKQIAAEVRAELLKHSARNGGRDRTVH